MYNENLFDIMFLLCKEVFMNRDKDGKIILTDKEAEIAAEVILNKWLKEENQSQKSEKE